MGKQKQRAEDPVTNNATLSLALTSTEQPSPVDRIEVTLGEKGKETPASLSVYAFEGTVDDLFLKLEAENDRTIDYPICVRVHRKDALLLMAAISNLLAQSADEN